MTTLEDLYYGNIAPHERYIRHGSREEKVLKLLCRNEESLTKNLNNRQKEMFNKFTDCQKELAESQPVRPLPTGSAWRCRLWLKLWAALKRKKKCNSSLPRCS